MKSVTVFLVLLSASAGLCGLLRDNNEYGLYYTSLDEELKEPFLRFQLVAAVISESEKSKEKPSPILSGLDSPEGLGISEELFRKLQELETPEGFSDHLYKLVKEKFELSILQIAELVATKSSCSRRSSRCWDLGDVGSNCC